MNILIDLEDVYYEGIKKDRVLDTSVQPILMSIKHGVEIPNNATNGDVIKALFPNIDTNFSNVIELNLWWNAPYKRGDTE